MKKLSALIKKFSTLNSQFSIPKSFVLIELIIVTAIIGIISAIGTGTFVSYSRTQKLQTATNDFVTTLNVAKSNSFSQVKDSTLCGSSQTLEGYKVDISCSTYDLYVVCAGDEHKIMKTKSLPDNVQFSTDLPFSIFFPVLTSQISDPKTYTISGFGQTSCVQIDSKGVISKPTVCPAPMGCPTPTPTPTVTPTPSNTPTPTPTTFPTPTPTPTITPTPTPTPTPAPSISGKVWVDINKDGVKQGGEGGYSGATITIEHMSSPFETYTATTNPGGNYLQVLTLGQQYKVTLTIPAGYGLTTANNGLTYFPTTVVNFGIALVPTPTPTVPPTPTPTPTPCIGLNLSCGGPTNCCAGLFCTTVSCSPYSCSYECKIAPPLPPAKTCGDSSSDYNYHPKSVLVDYCGSYCAPYSGTVSCTSQFVVSGSLWNGYNWSVCSQFGATSFYFSVPVCLLGPPAASPYGPPTYYQATCTCN